MTAGVWSLGLSRATALAINEAAELAASDAGRGVSVGKVAERIGAEPAEAREVLARLEQAGLVEADEREGEAYRLCRGARELPLFEIARAVDEPFEVCRLEGNGAVDDKSLASVLGRVNEEVIDLFKERRLSELLAEQA
ncbi:MAG: Rrf2 family transcriptional regulator [Planctomycetota bacterium]